MREINALHAKDVSVSCKPRPATGRWMAFGVLFPPKRDDFLAELRYVVPNAPEKELSSGSAMNEFARLCIDQLEKDAELFRQAAAGWQQLWDQARAELIDPFSGEKHTAEEMAGLYRRREQEVRELIERVRKLVQSI